MSTFDAEIRQPSDLLGDPALLDKSNPWHCDHSCGYERAEPDDYAFHEHDRCYLCGFVQVEYVTLPSTLEVAS